jgi:hypothetical protein
VICRSNIVRRGRIVSRMEKHKKTNLTVWVGLLLIAGALIIWGCSIIELKSNEIMLTTKNLSVEEVWRYEGALQWWRKAYVKAVLPTTGFLTISGIALISSPQILAFVEKGALRRLGSTSVEGEAFSSKDKVKEEPRVRESKV